MNIVPLAGSTLWNGQEHGRGNSERDGGPRSLDDGF